MTRVVLRTAARRVALLLLRSLATALLTVVFAVLHLPLRVGRDAAERVLAAVLPTASPGRLTIAHVDELSLRTIALSGVRYADSRDRPLVDGLSLETQHPVAALRALITGAPLPRITAHVRRVRVFDPFIVLPPPLPAGARAPSAPQTGPIVRLADVEITIDAASNELGEVPVEATNLRARGRFEAGPADRWRVDLQSLDGTVRALALNPEQLHVAATIEHLPGEAPRPRVEGSLSLHGAALDCELTAHLLADGRLDLRAPSCALSPAALDHLAANDLGLGPRVEDLSLSGVLGAPLAFRGVVGVGADTAPFHGTLSPDAQTLALTLAHLDLARIRAGLPHTDLDGALRLTHAFAAHAHGFSLDATALAASVAGVPLPPAEAAATLRGTTLTLDHLRAPSVGLDARGTLDLATHTPRIDAHADLSTRALQTLPWVRGLASGALDLTLDVHGTPDGLDGTLHSRADGLRVAGVSIPHATVDGDVAWRQQRGHLALRFDAHDVRRGAQFGPARLAGTLTGDPMGRMDVDLHASGDGLLAALQRPRGPATLGPTAAHLRATLDRSDGALRVSVSDSALTLRGSRARTRGEFHLDPRGAPHARLRVDLGPGGSADLGLDGPRATVALHNLDLAWLNRVVPLPTALSGRADGALQIAPAGHGGSHGTLDIRDFDVDPIGRVHATLSLMPTGALSTATVRLQSELGPTVTGTFSLRVPDALGDADGWFRGLRDGEVALDSLGPDAVRGFMPPLVVPTGSLSAHATLSREGAEGALQVVIDVLGGSLGAFVGSRHLAVVHPLRLRAHATLAIPSLHTDALPLAARVEVGDEVRQTRRGRAADSELIPDASLLGASVTLEGPWIRAISRAVAELSGARPLRAEALTAATRALLTEAHADLRARVGPVLRSEWPLRGIAEVLLPPPPVPAGSSGTVRVSLRGPLLSLTASANVEASLPSAEIVDLAEPARASVEVTVAPAPGDTLLGALTLESRGTVTLSPDAPAAVRREATLHAVLAARGDALLTRGLQALAVQRFDVDTDPLPLERFGLVRARDVTGSAQVRLRASGDPARPVRMEVTLDGLRAALREDSASQTRTPPLQALARAVVLREGDRWDVHACVAATGEGRPEVCDPEGAAVSVQDGATASLRAAALVPLVGALGRWRFDAARGRASVSARGFRLEPLAPFLPLGTVSYLGGVVSASARWDGGGIENVGGEFTLTDGRLEVPTLGEPVRNMTVHATLARRLVTLHGADADLGRGHVRATGDVVLGDDRANATLSVEATQMPAVQEGNTFGWIDGLARVGLEIRADGLRGDLSVERAQVLLHDQSIRTLQSLSAPAEYFVLGRTGDGSIVDSLRDFPMDFAVTLRTPVWVRRDDFAVAVRGAVSAHIDRGGTSLTGTVEQASTQSWIVEQGQRFDIERMSLQFHGGTRIDPEIEVVAHHDSPGIGRITATIGGRLSAITLALVAESQPDASMAEIASMLLFGRRDSPTASAGTPDLAERGVQMLAGQFASFLSTAIGREMAFRVRPILETSEAGGRVGGGVSVSPRLYVEASVSGSSSALAQGSTTTANAVELRSLGEYVLTSTVTLSSSLSTGTTAQYRWSVDLFWSP